MTCRKNILVNVFCVCVFKISHGKALQHVLYTVRYISTSCLIPDVFIPRLGSARAAANVPQLSGSIRSKKASSLGLIMTGSRFPNFCTVFPCEWERKRCKKCGRFQIRFVRVQKETRVLACRDDVSLVIEAMFVSIDAMII